MEEMGGEGTGGMGGEGTGEEGSVVQSKKILKIHPAFYKSY